MLIIEGSDLVGKTELCKVLINRLWSEGYPVIPQHFGLLPDDWDFYWDYLGFINRRTVMDRFIMSEVVYGHVVRSGSRISPEIYRLLDAHLILQGSVTVVITATSDRMEQQVELKFAGRNEVFEPAQIEKANEGFRKLVQKPHTRMGDCWSYSYVCNFDVHYEMELGSMYPSSNLKLIDQIIKLYIKRLELLEAIDNDT
jgi:hypothetical protein